MVSMCTCVCVCVCRFREACGKVAKSNFADMWNEKRVEFIPVEWRSGLSLDNGSHGNMHMHIIGFQLGGSRTEVSCVRGFSWDRKMSMSSIAVFGGFSWVVIRQVVCPAWVSAG